MLKAGRSLLRLLLLPLFLALAAGPVLAGEAEDAAALDQLFAQLRAAPDPGTAHEIDQRIWFYWTTPIRSDPCRPHA